MPRVGRGIRLAPYFHSGAFSLSTASGVGEFNAVPATFTSSGRQRITGTGSFTAAKATFNGFGRLTAVGTFTAAPATFNGVGNIGVAPNLTIDEQGPRDIRFPLPSVAWSVDGLPVTMYDASWSSAWDGGYDQMRGSLTLDDLRRTDILQESEVQGVTSTGVVVFEGRISTPPQISDGMAHIGAQGKRVKAQQKVERLFIQSRGMDIWTATNSEPHLDGTGGSVYSDSQKIGVEIHGGLGFVLDRNVDVANDRANGAVFYAEGVNIQRVAYFGHWDAVEDTPNLAIQVLRANGPTGSTTLVNSANCSSGNRNEEKDITFAVPDDLVIIQLHSSAAITPDDKKRYQVTRIRVNSDICLGDHFTGSDVAGYIGDQLGWDTTGVTDSTDNVLPFDWDDGSWADALTYLAETDDRYWRLTADRGAGPVLTYDDWGTNEWTAYLSRGTVASITPEEVFNRVWVWYETPNGVRRRTIVEPGDIGEDDPLDVANVYEYELNDRQYNGTMAYRVGQRVLGRVMRPRHSGSLDCAMLFDPSGASRPYDALAGDTVRIADWGAAESLTLRIVETEADSNGVRLGVERPISLGGLLGGHHKKRRHHGNGGGST